MTRIAMWSGPRNISTAMMRSFGARADAVVVDEPFYAYYLRESGLEHPGREEILAAQPQALPDVVAGLDAPLPDGVTVQYEKHMTHHMLTHTDLDWAEGRVNAYLIRDPARVVTSYAKVRERPTLSDIGFAQQIELFRRFPGPVVDADDLLADPPAVLEKLCMALGINFDPAMLQWPAGRRESDGVWAPYWYSSVEASTGFAKPATEKPSLVEDLKDVWAAAVPLYEEMSHHRLR
jgi:hypothetical protein